MKSNTKSSITLPVRRGLRLLKEVTDRETLRDAYRRASAATRRSLAADLAELDHLTAEGLDER
jgi:hypothetical protein